MTPSFTSSFASQAAIAAAVAATSLAFETKFFISSMTTCGQGLAETKRCS